MNREELDEKVNALDRLDFEIRHHDTLKLIRDVVAAVTPEKWNTADTATAFLKNVTKGRNKAIDTIEQNTRELLG